MSNEPQDLIDWQSETEREREREGQRERGERERKRGGKREAADAYTLAAAAKATFAEESHVRSRGIYEDGLLGTKRRGRGLPYMTLSS